MAILILGKAFGGFDGFGCFGAFSVGAGEAARGRFNDFPTGAIALPRSLVGSWMSLDHLSVQGGSTSISSSSSLEPSSSSSSSPSDSHSSSLSPLLASPSSAYSCAPLGVEYISVMA